MRMKEKTRLFMKDSKADINQIIKTVNSNEFKRKGCSAWLVGWEDNHLSKEYKRRKELLK